MPNASMHVTDLISYHNSFFDGFDHAHSLKWDLHFFYHGLNQGCQKSFPQKFWTQKRTRKTTDKQGNPAKDKKSPSYIDIQIYGWWICVLWNMAENALCIFFIAHIMYVKISTRLRAQMTFAIMAIILNQVPWKYNLMFNFRSDLTKILFSDC